MGLRRRKGDTGLLLGRRATRRVGDEVWTPAQRAEHRRDLADQASAAEEAATVTGEADPEPMG